MYDFTIQEMSDRVFAMIADKGIGLTKITNEDVRNTLKSYWEDKIAVTWEIQDVDAVLIEDGYDEKYLSRDGKINVLARVFDHHDAEYGVSWNTLKESMRIEVSFKEEKNDESQEYEEAFL